MPYYYRNNRQKRGIFSTSGYNQQQQNENGDYQKVITISQIQENNRVLNDERQTDAGRSGYMNNKIKNLQKQKYKVIDDRDKTKPVEITANDVDKKFPKAENYDPHTQTFTDEEKERVKNWNKEHPNSKIDLAEIEEYNYRKSKEGKPEEKMSVEHIVSQYEAEHNHQQQLEYEHALNSQAKSLENLGEVEHSWSTTFAPGITYEGLNDRKTGVKPDIKVKERPTIWEPTEKENTSLDNEYKAYEHGKMVKEDHEKHSNKIKGTSKGGKALGHNSSSNNHGTSYPSGYSTLHQTNDAGLTHIGVNDPDKDRPNFQTGGYKTIGDAVIHSFGGKTGEDVFKESTRPKVTKGPFRYTTNYDMKWNKIKGDEIPNEDKKRHMEFENDLNELHSIDNSSGNLGYIINNKPPTNQTNTTTNFVKESSVPATTTNTTTTNINDTTDITLDIPLDKKSTNFSNSTTNLINNNNGQQLLSKVNSSTKKTSSLNPAIDFAQRYLLAEKAVIQRYQPYRRS
jgi:hypothetical protein